jgi:hypothetical protein
MKQTKRNVEYNIKVFKSKGIIERFGSDKTGGCPDFSYQLE